MSNIKRHFISRFPNGYLVEADYSQLEIIALAYLTQDPQLVDDILSGRDMHCVRAAELARMPEAYFLLEYLKGNPDFIKKRKIAKAFSFQLQYGSGAKNMAKTNGTTVKEAQDFIDNYYARYPKVLQWQEHVMDSVKSSRTWDGTRRTPAGYPQGIGQYIGPTGRMYSFAEYDNDYRPGTVSFSPTQMKNYPVQGFATGDIVPMILGKLFRVLKNNPDLCDDFLLVNTVHDSIIFDVKDINSLRIGTPIVEEVMQQAPLYLKEDFDIDFNLPLNVEIKYGKNWMELEKIK